MNLNFTDLTKIEKTDVLNLIKSIFIMYFGVKS